MSKPAKPLPRFKTEAQERAYWETEGRDSTQFLDWTKAQRVVLPELKPILITL
ncbi:MAG: CopG family antitoxin [Burkholderiaceae bacterium]